MVSNLMTIALVALPAIFAGVVMQGCGGGGGGGGSPGGGSPAGASSGGSGGGGGGGSFSQSISNAVGQHVSGTVHALCAAATNQTFSEMRSELIDLAKKFCGDTEAKAESDAERQAELDAKQAAKEAAYKEMLAAQAVAEEHRDAADKAKEAYENITKDVDAMENAAGDNEGDNEARRLSTSRWLAAPPPPSCVELQTVKVDEILAAERDNLTAGCQRLYAQITLADFLQDGMEEHAKKIQEMNHAFMQDFQKTLRKRMEEAAMQEDEGNATNATVNETLEDDNTEAEAAEPKLSASERLRLIKEELKKIVKNSTSQALSK